MYKSLLFLLVALVGCTHVDPEPPVNSVTHFVTDAHNSFGDFYAGLPLGLTLRDARIKTYPYQLKFVIDHGDQVVDTAYYIATDYKYAVAGDYRIRITIEQEGNTFTFDSVLHVIEAPKAYGVPETGEYARLLYFDGSGSLRLVFSTGTVQDGFMNFNTKLLSGLDFELPVHMPGNDFQAHLVNFVASADGKVCLIEGSFVKVYTVPNQLAKAVFVGNDFHDFRFVNEDPQILYDSVHLSQTYVCTKTLNLTPGPSTSKRSPFPASMWPLQNLFFSGSSTALATFSGSGAQNYILREMDFDGNTVFERDNPELLTFESRPPALTLLSTGKMLVSARHKLVKLDANNSEQWRRDIPYYIGNGGAEIQQRKVIVKELGNFIYVFFDDMRCMKLDQNGSLVWERFYYPEASAFVQTIVMDPSGNWLMAGNRVGFNNGPIDQADIENCDIVFIRITPDGDLVD